jgi:hypothetical protein
MPIVLRSKEHRQLKLITHDYEVKPSGHFINCDENNGPLTSFHASEEGLDAA